MFELGKYSFRVKYELEEGCTLYNHKDRLIISVEPGYFREFDVRTQMELMFPGIEISSTLEDIKEKIVKRFNLT